MREVVIIDGVRSANTRAHKTKGCVYNCIPY
jgi:hypothetical protein